MIINKAISREYGYALRGKKIFRKIRGKRARKLNIIGFTPMTHEINRDTMLFNGYLEKIWGSDQIEIRVNYVIT